jgi:tRNA1Val (adenine37-N6)-methyltransferase
MTIEGFTCDSLLRGRVILHQPKHGFRSSLDPVLLAGWFSPPYGQFLDIGCGTGALSFLLLARDPEARGTAVEIQARLATLAGTGLSENTFALRLEILHQDVRTFAGVDARKFNCVVTNPPFRPVGKGNLPPKSERALAHHEVCLSLAEWVNVASRTLRTDGRLAVIFPADRYSELVQALAIKGFYLQRSRPVLSRENEPAIRWLVEAGFSQTPPVVEPPLVVHEADRFTPEVLAMLGDTPTG